MVSRALIFNEYIIMTPEQIASRCIQGAIDQPSKENITKGGYLWDLEKEIAEDIKEYAKNIRQND